MTDNTANISGRRARRRRAVFVLCGLVLVFAVGLPFTYYAATYVAYPPTPHYRAWGLEFGYLFWFWGVVPVLPTLVFVFIDALKNFKWSGFLVQALRFLCMTVCVLGVLLGGFMVSMGLVGGLKAPRAEIVFPDDFQGPYVIAIDNWIEPSLTRIHPLYTYHVPESGYLRVDSGWIDPGGWFKDGVSTPRGHYSWFRREGDNGLHARKYYFYNLDYRSGSTRVRGLSGFVSFDDIKSYKKDSLSLAKQEQIDAKVRQFIDSVLAP